MATRNTAYFVTAIRQLANMEDDPIVTDPEVIDRASEGKAALYDMIVGSFEHYAVTPFDFTLAGGIGGNSVALPTDFYKDISLTFNPTSSPRTVHRMSSWVDRNNLSRIGYTLLGSSLVVNPPNSSAGNYELLYTPLDKPFGAPVSVAAQAPTFVTIAVNAGVDNVIGTGLGTFTFGAAAFPSGVAPSGALSIAGAANAANNGVFPIAVRISGTQVLAIGTFVNETFGGGVVAKYSVAPVDGVYSGVWTLRGAALDQTLVGATLVVTGSTLYSGTFTVASVLSSTTFTITASPSATPEVFGAAVTAVFQPSGTVNDLPQIMAPWYEFIQVHGAIAIKDKIEQDTSDLEMRLERLTARIKGMAANRMEEGGQIGLPNASNGFWDEPGTPWG